MFFDYETCGILGPQPGTELTPPALEGEVLTIGRPGKYLQHILILQWPQVPGDFLNVPCSCKSQDSKKGFGTLQQK